MSSPLNYTPPPSELKVLSQLQDLVAFRDDLIRLRNALGNRIGAKKNGNKWSFLKRYTVCPNKHMVLLKEDEERDKCPICGAPVTVVEEEPSQDLVERFNDLLRQQEVVEKLIAGLVTQFPEFTNFLAYVKGVGEANAGRLLVYGYPPKFNFDVNKFRSYAGLALVFECPKCGYYHYAGKSSDGTPPVPTPEGWACPHDGTKLVGRATRNGDLVKYNRHVKTFLLGILSTNLVMAGGVYALIYRRYKEEVQEKHPDWPAIKVARTAVRKTVSLLLSHYYAVSASVRLKVPIREAYKIVLGKEYEVLSKHEDFIGYPLMDGYVEGDKKTPKYKAKFEEVVKELGIDKNEVIAWLKKKKIIS